MLVEASRIAVLWSQVFPLCANLDKLLLPTPESRAWHENKHTTILTLMVRIADWTEVVDVTLYKQFKSTETKEYTVLTHPSQKCLSERRWLSWDISNRSFINTKSWCLRMTGLSLLSFAHHTPSSRGASALGLRMGIQEEKRGSEGRDRKPKRHDVLFPKMHPEPTLPNHLRPSCHSCIFPPPAWLIFLPFHTPPSGSKLP